MKKWQISIISLAIIIFGVLFEHFFVFADTNNVIDYAIDKENNLFLLSFDKDESTYRLSKISKNSNIIYKVDLDKSEDPSLNRVYKEVYLDSQGNIFLLLDEEKTKDTSTENNSLKAKISDEKILMYDNEDGAYKREIAEVDFTKQTSLPTTPYISKLQIVGQKMSIICRQGTRYDILVVNTAEDAKPSREQTFNIVPDRQVSDEDVWVNDMSILSDGSVVYTTRAGGLFMLDKDKNTKNIKENIFSADASFAIFSIDESDNVYFTEISSGNFYKYNLKNSSLEIVYNSKSVINKEGKITFGDVKGVYCIGSGCYYGISKNSSPISYLGFGTNENSIYNIRNQFFPYRLFTIIIISASLAAIVVLGFFAYKKFKKRIPLILKIIFLFLPVYLIAIAILSTIFIKSTDDDYTTVLTDYQEIGANIILKHIDGNTFQSMNHLSGYMGTEYNSIRGQIQSGVTELENILGGKSDYIITYVVKDSKIYTSITNKTVDTYKDTDKIGIYADYPASMPVEYVEEQTVSDKIYSAWNNLKGKAGDSAVEVITFRDERGEWTSVLRPIKNSNGESIGMLANVINKTAYQDDHFWAAFSTAMILILSITILIFVYLYFALKFSFRPLREISRSVNKIGTGQWSTKFDIKSKDEFADIARAFNVMIDKINQYVSNLVVLNKEYIKFVPQELFKLLGKSKVTEIKLYDKNKMNLSILYITFNIICHDVYGSMSEEDLFKIMNQSYSEIFGVVENNNGVVQWFDGLGAMILFPNSAVDALNASMQFKEVFVSKKVRERMRMVLSTGETLIGVSGSNVRNGILTISDEIMRIYHINGQLERIGMKHVAFEQLVNRLPSEAMKNCRFVGQINSMSSQGPIKLYEFMDVTRLNDKNLYTATKKMFERGVELYIQANFFEARKIFANVLRVNEEDKVAMYYLLRCDESEKGGKANWSGTLFD